MQQTFAGQLFNALSWTLIHSLWQGLVLTIVAGVMVAATKRSSPSLRYSLLTGLLFFFLGTTFITFLWQWQINPGTHAKPLTNAALITGNDFAPQNNWWSSFTGIMDRNSGWIITAWSVIVGLKVVRLVVDLYYVNRLCTSYVNTPGEAIKIRLQQLCRDMGIRKHVLLLESRLVNIPWVAGHFKPVILVPLGIFSKLTPAEVEAVLLHELAHIRRHDYLVNLVQRITSIIYFFNPGVLWLSSLIRAERENCCDDIAITHTSDKMQFVEALVRVKEHSMSSPALAMNFLGQKNQLLDRVNRIVYNRNKSLNVAEVLFLVCSLVCTIVWLGSVGKTVSTNANLFPAFRSMESAKHSSKLMYVQSEEDRTTPIIHLKEQPSVIINTVPKQELAKASIDTSERKTNEPGKENISFNDPLIEHPVATPVEPGQEIARPENSQHERDRINAEQDRIQAESDRKQAERDRVQADKDREQAEKDRKQAALDRIQADKDRAQAALDRKQADKDREQAERERKSMMY